MWRVAALVVIIGAGCASNEDYVCKDGVLGDLASRFSTTQRYAPTSSISAPAFYPDMAGKPSAASAPASASAATSGNP